MLPKLLFLLLLVLLLPLLKAGAQQDHKIDSIKGELEVLRDTHRIRPLLQLGRLQRDVEPKEGLGTFEKALELSREHRYLWGEASSLYGFARVNWKLGEYEESLSYITTALKLVSEDQSPLLYTKCLAHSANMHRLLGHRDSALVFIDRGIEMARRFNFYRTHSNLSHIRGLVYFSDGDFEAARKSFDEAVRLLLTDDPKNDISKIQLDLARFHMEKGMVDSCLYVYKKALQSLKHGKKPSRVALIKLNIGLVQMIQGDMDSCKLYFESALELASQLDDFWLKKSSHYALYEMYKRLGSFEKAIYHISEAVALARSSGDMEEVQSLQFHLAIIYQKQDKLALALPLLLEGAEICDTLSLGPEQAKFKRVLSGIYHRMHYLDEALEYGREALRLESINNSPVRIALSNITLGYVLTKLEAFDEAESAFKEAKRLSEEVKSVENQLASLHGLIGVCLKQSKLASANHYLDSALAFGEEVVDKHPYYAHLRSAQGRLLIKQGRYKKAIQAFHRALNLNEGTSKKTISLECYTGLARAYEQLGDYRQSLLFRKKQMGIDSILNDKARLFQIAHMQAEFEDERKQSEIKLLKEKNALASVTLTNQQASLDKQRQTTVFILLGCLLLLSTGLLLFNGYRLKQKNNKLLLASRQTELEHEQERTKQHLEQAKFKADFLTSVSHELRTPLTLILGPLEKLLSKDHLEHRTDLQRINQSATRLLELVNETLDLSKLESGYLPLRPTSQPIGAAVRKIAQTFAPLAERNAVELKVDDHSEGLSVDFDEEKMEKVLTNLLQNAFTHTKPGADIAIVIDPPSENDVTIHVKDSGKGIAPEHLPRLFDRFYQADAKAATGTGIGLALTKQLIELHRGTISVTSKPGIGSTFDITIPLQQEATVQPSIQTNGVELEHLKKMEPSEAVAESGKTILIIEDNEEVREYLNELLSPIYRTLLAEDGDAGIRIAETHSPDLVVSDIMMPGKDGLELTAHLKQHFPTSHIPIVLLTAKASLDHRLEGLKTGADDYLSKPFHSKELLQRCQNLLEQRDRLRVVFSKDPWIAPSQMAATDLDKEFLQKAVAIVESHLDDPELTVEDFCKQLAYNRSGVYLKLKALTGENTSHFIKTVRLRKAAELIQSTNHGMTEIATMVGFRTRQTFNKAFREQFHTTPTEYRKNRRSKDRVAGLI